MTNRISCVIPMPETKNNLRSFSLLYPRCPVASLMTLGAILGGVIRHRVNAFLRLFHPLITGEKEHFAAAMD